MAAFAANAVKGNPPLTFLFAHVVKLRHYFDGAAGSCAGCAGVGAAACRLSMTFVPTINRLPVAKTNWSAISLMESAERMTWYLTKRCAPAVATITQKRFDCKSVSTKFFIAFLPF